MRFAILFCLSLIAGPLLGGPTCAQDAGNSLSPYAVHVGTFYGVYLGRGLVITAAHIVDQAPRVEIAGKDVPAQVVKRGDFNDVDLTLLSIGEHDLPASLGPLRMSLCQNPPKIGQPIVVVIPERVTPSYVMSPSLFPSDLLPKFHTAIRYIERYPDLGKSGSGVFDAEQKCLLGIVSRKIVVTTKEMNGSDVKELHDDIARYFVPASEIAQFIPAELHF